MACLKNIQLEAVLKFSLTLCFDQFLCFDKKHLYLGSSEGLSVLKKKMLVNETST
jgi:hypothetical protein